MNMRERERGRKMKSDNDNAERKFSSLFLRHFGTMAHNASPITTHHVGHPGAIDRNLRHCDICDARYVVVLCLTDHIPDHTIPPQTE
jgi:hypothetical protein